jgi:nitrate reductase gamma subunit
LSTGYGLWRQRDHQHICQQNMDFEDRETINTYVKKIWTWSLCLQRSYFVDICVDGPSAFKVHILLTCVDGLSAFKVHILLTYVLMVSLPYHIFFLYQCICTRQCFFSIINLYIIKSLSKI